MSRYPAGGRVRAYRDPVRPQHAFLVRAPGFTPYGFLLFGLLLMTASLSVERMRLSFGRRRVAFGSGEICLGLAALPVAHYAYVWLLTRGG